MNTKLTMWAGILSLIIKILDPVLGLVTKELRDALEDWIVSFAAKCKATENPWDDMLAQLLADIFDIDIED